MGVVHFHKGSMETFTVSLAAKIGADPCPEQAVSAAIIQSYPVSCLHFRHLQHVEVFPGAVLFDGMHCLRGKLHIIMMGYRIPIDVVLSATARPVALTIGGGDAKRLREIAFLPKIAQDDGRVIKFVRGDKDPRVVPNRLDISGKIVQLGIPRVDGRGLRD